MGTKKSVSKARPAAQAKANGRAMGARDGKEGAKGRKGDVVGGREDGTHVGAVIASLAAQHPGITAAHRAAYGSLVGDGESDELGRRTRAADVLAEAVRWAVQMDGDLRGHFGAVKRYSGARFVHFLERVRALNETLQVEQAKRRKLDATRSNAGKEREAAMLARKELLQAMRTFAGRRAAERAALGEATKAAGEATDGILRSIEAALGLAREWVARADETSRILAGDAGLDRELIDGVAAAAEALRAAATGATVEGRATAADSPPTNRAEGRVLFEMIEARRIWAEANERTGLVKKLIPSASLRHVFGLSSRGADTGANAPTDEAAPPPPA